jgi:hypothetical protein
MQDTHPCAALKDPLTPLLLKARTEISKRPLFRNDTKGKVARR